MRDMLLQSCLTLCDPMNCSPPRSSVHGILQARTLEWVATPSSRGSFWPRDWIWVSYVSCIGRWVFFFYHQRHLGSTILKQLNAYTHTPTHGLRLIHLYIYSNKKHMLYFKTITLPPQNRKSGFLTLQSQDIRIWGKSQIWWNAYKLTPSGNSYMWRCAFQLMEQSVKNKIGNLIWQKVALQFVTWKMFWKNWHYYGLPREFLR